MDLLAFAIPFQGCASPFCAMRAPNKSGVLVPSLGPTFLSSSHLYLVLRSESFKLRLKCLSALAWTPRSLLAS